MSAAAGEGQPRVSVYLPTRNRATQLRRAVESVLAQDMGDLELIVVDDASTDATAVVLATLAATDPRVRVLHNARRAGAPASRNLALRHARGRYATGLDDDDEMLPQRLGALLAAFDEQHAFIASAAVLRSPHWARPSRATTQLITLAQQLYGDQVGTQVLSLRERFLEVGGFDETMPAWQDYDLWTRMIARFGAALRIATPSYVVHMDDTLPRISDRGAEGARRYIEKHAALMNPAQRERQELEALMLGRGPLRLADALRVAGPASRATAWRYYVSSHVPALRGLAEHYRRWRWPAHQRSR